MFFECSHVAFTFSFYIKQKMYSLINMLQYLKAEGKIQNMNIKSSTIKSSSTKLENVNKVI